MICALLFPGLTFAQSVNEKFDKLTISENFDTVNTYWTTLSNVENLFIVQDGEYILQRRANAAPYAIIAEFENEFSDYRAVASMKLDHSMGELAHMGLLFMMQKEGQGGFLVEINKKKEYRLRQIVGGSYRFISGSSKDNGWTKHNSLNEPNFSNLIEIRCYKGSYDLFLNNVFARSFSEPNYKSGKMGLIIGPDSRGKVDFLYIFTKSAPGATVSKSPENKNDGTSSVTGPDLIDLAESIIQLKTQINELDEENEGLRKTISALNTGDQEKDVTIRNFEKLELQYKDQLKKKDLSIDSLNKVVTSLERYREIVGDNSNGDIIINLSKALKAEKEKNQKLESELLDYKEKQIAPKTGQPKSNSKPINNKSTPPEQTGDTKKDPNVFSLPKE